MDTIQCNYCRMNVAASADNRCPSCSQNPYEVTFRPASNNESHNPLFQSPPDLRELSIYEKAQLRSLVSSRVSAEAIDLFFLQIGFREADIPHLYRLHNLRRKQIQYAHRSKRTVRIAGGLIMFLGLGLPVIAFGTGSRVGSLLLASYGAALIATGDVTVFVNQNFSTTRRW